MDRMTYDEKLLLFMKHTKNRGMLNQMTRKANPEKLDYELQKLGLIEKSKAEAKVKPEKKRPVYSKAPPQNPERLVIVRNEREFKYQDLPARIQKLWDDNRDNYKLVRSLHEKLKLMDKAPDTNREPLTCEITSRIDLIRSNWEIIDAWQPGDEEKEQSAEGKEQSAEMDYKRVSSNRKYISKNLPYVTSGNVKADYFRENIQQRYNEMKAANIEMNSKTLAELKGAGIEL